MPRDLQPNFTGGEIAPSLHARTDLDRYHIALAKCKNWIIQAQGGVSTRGGTKVVNRAPFGSKARLIPFQFNIDQSYMLAFGFDRLSIVRDGDILFESGTMNITNITATNPALITVTSHNLKFEQTVLIDGTGVPALDGKRFSIDYQNGNTFEVPADGTGWTSGGTIQKAYEIYTGIQESQLEDLKFTQSADVLTITHPERPVQEVRRLGELNWQIANKTYGSSVSAPTGVAITQSGTASSAPNRDYRYQVTAVDAEGSESLPSSIASSGSINSLSSTYGNLVQWDAVTGAEYYNVYKEDSTGSGSFGFIGEAGPSRDFLDYNYAPSFFFTPPISQPVFDAADKYPSCVAYHQQRMVLASTDSAPQEVRLSKTGDYDNFDVSRPTRDDDAISFSISSRQVNRIIHLLSLDTLMAFTSEAPWIISGNGSDVLTPSSLSARRQGGYGSSKLAPIVIGESALYVQSKGSKVRDLSYNFNDDKYVSADLSLMADHLFFGYTIKDWCYSAEPYGMIWAVRSDGILLSLTYLKDQQVWGWAQHETAGEVENIASIPEGDEDVVYMVVKRMIEGQDVRYIERLNERRFTAVEDVYAVDCGITYDGAATDTITGLDHLEGQYVSVLADGNVVTDKVVQNGAITLDEEASKVHVGLGYDCDLKTLPIDFQGSTSVQSIKKSVSSVVLKVEDTRGLSVGKDENNLYEVKERDVAHDYGSIPLTTGEQRVDCQAGWSTNGEVFIRQAYPLPATILAIIPEINVG